MMDLQRAVGDSNWYVDDRWGHWLTLIHAGNPVPKSRARVVNGRAFTPAKTVKAQEELAWAIKDVLPITEPDDCDFAVEMRFFLKDWQRIDLDNLVKLVFDACTGLVWVDDVQVTESHSFLVRGDPEPRTEIIIDRKDAVRRVNPPCIVCGKPVKSPQARSCSRECGNAARRLARPCAECGKEVERPQSQVKGEVFCDGGCRSAYWKKRRTKTAKGSCDVCGGPVSRKEYQRCQACACEVGKPQRQLPPMTVKLIEGARKSGLSFAEIAVALNDQSVPTVTGRGRWHAATVQDAVQGRWIKEAG